MLMTNCLDNFFPTSVGTCVTNASLSVLVRLGLSVWRVGSTRGACPKGSFTGSQSVSQSLRKFLANERLRQNSLAIANGMVWCTQMKLTAIAISAAMTTTSAIALAFCDPPSHKRSPAKEFVKNVMKKVTEASEKVTVSNILGPVRGRTDFSRIFIFEPPDFFADFLAGFFLLIFVGKSAQKNPPRKSPGKPSKIYTTKIPDTFLQRGRAKIFQKKKPSTKPTSQENKTLSPRDSEWHTDAEFNCC